MSRRSNSAGHAVIHPARSQRERMDTAELREALEEALSRRSGTQRHVAELERSPSIYSTSFAIDELAACLDDGTSLRMLYKDLSRRTMLESARWVKPVSYTTRCAR